MPRLAVALLVLLGPATLSAQDCPQEPDARGLCPGGAASLDVVLDNAPPVLTWPTAGTVLSGLVNFRATAPEGRVSFFLAGSCEGRDDSAEDDAERTALRARCGLPGSRMAASGRV